ncbi:10443_t:CDS:2, partial [Funneliformis geosporum]
MNNNQRKWGSRRTFNHDQNHKWASLRPRYDWNDAYDNTVAPRDHDLENDLFGEENHIHTGINFAKYAKIKVIVRPECIAPISSFDEANLHSSMKDVVRLARYSIPTPVQKYSIPIITEGKDLMACAQTGSGKTAAFLIPILSKLFGKAKGLAAPRPRLDARFFKVEPLVLILGPTRELVTQIFDECRRFTYRTMLRPCVVYGGGGIIEQKNELAKGCDVLSATPGRIIDFFERGFISLRRVKYLVLDEADRMLDLGFETVVRNIVENTDLCNDGTRQTLMYSATFPKPIRKLAKDFLANDYVFLTVGRVGGTTSDITQKVIYVKEQNKRDCLVELLLKQPPSRTLIFVETKRGADSLDNFLYNRDFPTTSIHGDRSQIEREDASGRSPILIATDVAARGLDIKDVMHVVNYDLCNNIDDYVH